MITTKEILDLVRNFVKTNDLDVFSHSFAEIFYDIETTGDANAIQLANTIEGELAAVTAGVCPKSGLPDAVKSLLPTISVVIPELPALKAQEIDFMYLWGQMEGAETVTLVPFGIAPAAGFSLGAAPPGIPQSNTTQFVSQRVLEAQ